MGGAGDCLLPGRILCLWGRFQIEAEGGGQEAGPGGQEGTGGVKEEKNKIVTPESSHKADARECRCTKRSAAL